MATVTLDLVDGPRVTYTELSERIKPYLHNRIPHDFVYDNVRDAVIQVCRDLDFIRTTFEVPKNDDPEDVEYTLIHQGYSFGNPIAAWHNKRHENYKLPPTWHNDVMIDINTTKVFLPSEIHYASRNRFFFMISIAPARDSTDFPTAVYDQEAQLIITKCRTTLREFDQHPLPEGVYREKLGRVYTRYISTPLDNSVGMFI